MKLVESEILSFEFTDKLAKKLVAEKMFTPPQLEKAKEVGSRSQKHLGSVLISLGYVTERALTDFVSEQLSMPFVNLKHYLIDPDVITLVSAEIAYRYRFIPIFRVEDVITVALVQPLDLFALDRIRFGTGHKIQPLLCSEKSILEAINRFYPRVNHLKGMVDEIKSYTPKVEDEE